MDSIVTVDGKEVSHPGEVYAVVRRQLPNTPFRYAVERDGKCRTLIIPSMKFSFQDWLLTYSYGIYLLTGLSFLVICFNPSIDYNKIYGF